MEDADDLLVDDDRSAPHPGVALRRRIDVEVQPRSSDAISVGLPAKPLRPPARLQVAERFPLFAPFDVPLREQHLRAGRVVACALQAEHRDIERARAEPHHDRRNPSVLFPSVVFPANAKTARRLTLLIRDPVARRQDTPRRDHNARAHPNDGALGIVRSDLHDPRVGPARGTAAHASPRGRAERSKLGSAGAMATLARSVADAAARGQEQLAPRAGRRATRNKPAMRRRTVTRTASPRAPPPPPPRIRLEPGVHFVFVTLAGRQPFGEVVDAGRDASSELVASLRPTRHALPP
jgi:hypothetical protein